MPRPGPETGLAGSGYREFFWVSSPAARHSRNLAERPQAGIVIFDSHVPAGIAQAVYMTATAAEMTPDELLQGIEVFSASRDAHQEAVQAICAAPGPLPAAGRLKSTMVWCQAYGVPSRRRSVWAVTGEHQPAAAWTPPGTGSDGVADGRTGRLLRSRGSVKQQVENKNEFWAEVTAIAVCPVAIAAGVAKGAYDASTDNGAFVDGFSAAAAPIIRAARGFGEEHGTTITKGVVTGAAGTLGARIMREGLKHVVG